MRTRIKSRAIPAAGVVIHLGIDSTISYFMLFMQRPRTEKECLKAHEMRHGTKV